MKLDFKMKNGGVNMSEFKHFAGGEPFLRPEKPFLLIYTDTYDAVSYAWLESGFYGRKEIKVWDL